MTEQKHIKFSYADAPTLQAFAMDNSLYRGIMGPVGAGKSSACVVEIINRALAQKPGPDGVRRTRWAVVRNSYPELRDTTIRTVMQWLPPMYFGKYTEYKHSYVVTAFEKCEFEIIFLALDRPDDIKKLLSLELTGAWVNEAREVPWAVIEMLQTRIRRYPSMVDGGPSWHGIWLDTNPPEQDSRWFKFFEEEKHRPGFSKLFKQPSGLAPNAENLSHLNGGRAYYEDLIQGKSPEWIKIYVHGDYGFVMDGKAIYPEYSDRIHCRDDVDPIPGVPIIRSFDFGLTPACAFSQMLPDGRWLTFDEMVSENMSIDEFSDDVLEHCNRAFKGDVQFEDWGDPAGQQRAQTDKRTCFEIMHAKGLMIEGSIQNPQMRHEAVRKPLRTLIAGEPQFILHSRCKQLRKGFMGGYHRRRLKTSAERYSDQADKNKYSHIHDALQYGCVQYFAQTLTGVPQGDNYPQFDQGDYIGGDDGRSPYSGY